MAVAHAAFVKLIHVQAFVSVKLRNNLGVRGGSGTGEWRYSGAGLR